MYHNISPILSSDSRVSRLGYDRAFTTLNKTYFTPNSAMNKWFNILSSDNEGGEGSQSVLKPSYENFQNTFNTSHKGNVEIQNRVNKYNKSIQVLSGDRTGEDKSPTSPY